MRDAKKKKKRRSAARMFSVTKELYDLAKVYGSAKAILAVAPIGTATAQALLNEDPIVMTYENFKHIRACLKSGMEFSFANKLHHIMRSTKIANSYTEKIRAFAKFIADNPWLIAPGGKITKVYTNSDTHTPLITAMNEMKKVDKLLKRIHKEVPMYDEVLFAGTGYLEMI
jgi:hypothetical protein